MNGLWQSATDFLGFCTKKQMEMSELVEQASERYDKVDVISKTLTIAGSAIIAGVFAYQARELVVRAQNRTVQEGVFARRACQLTWISIGFLALSILTAYSTYNDLLQ